MSSPELELGFVPASSGAALVDELVVLVNGVYAVAESALWRRGAVRTTSSEIAGLIAAGEIVVARRGEAVIGCVHVRRVDEELGEFGMLAVNPDERGMGVGSRLVTFAEERCAADGLRVMQLELLVACEFRHPAKVFLEGWYTRIGYRRAGTIELVDTYPQLAPMLAAPCELRRYRKPLATLGGV